MPQIPTTTFRLPDRTLDELRELTELLTAHDVRSWSRATALSYAVHLALVVSREELQPSDGAVVFPHSLARADLGSRGARAAAAG